MTYRNLCILMFSGILLSACSGENAEERTEDTAETVQEPAVSTSEPSSAALAASDQESRYVNVDDERLLNAASEPGQ